jgi:hypothetical protein
VTSSEMRQVATLVVQNETDGQIHVWAAAHRRNLYRAAGVEEGMTGRLL